MRHRFDGLIARTSPFSIKKSKKVGSAWQRHRAREERRRGRVAHVGRFDALEDQMCAFGADGTVRGRSPDRADALVWAITDLLLSDTTKPSVRML